MAPSEFVERGLIQASIVSCVVRRRLLESGTITVPLVPSKLNACPASPLANDAPPDRVPLLVPAMSLALPSPGHQPTSPAGGVAQGGGGTTASTAFELVTTPNALLTMIR